MLRSNHGRQEKEVKQRLWKIVIGGSGPKRAGKTGSLPPCRMSVKSETQEQGNMDLDTQMLNHSNMDQYTKIMKWRNTELDAQELYYGSG